MLTPYRIERRGPEVLRSQLALEVGLALYAALSALLLIRVTFLFTGIGGLNGAGRVVFAASDPLLAPFGLIPAAQRPLLGSATLGDLTALGLVVLIPLTLLMRNRSRQPNPG